MASSLVYTPLLYAGDSSQVLYICDTSLSTGIALSYVLASLALACFCDSSLIQNIFPLFYLQPTRCVGTFA